MRKVYELVIVDSMTEKKIYEKWYGITEALKRVYNIKDCYNIYAIDVVSAETAEVLLTIEEHKTTYVSTEIPMLVGKEEAI